MLMSTFVRRKQTMKASTGFVQIAESPEIKMLSLPGLESPGKGGSWKTLEKSWNSKVVVLEILLPA